MSLVIQNIQKSFGDKEVLADISFTIEQGQFVSVLGPSGSGKSTLFSIIGGILKPEAGAITLGQASILNQSGHISYMPQQDALFPWRTILKNVVIGQELHGRVDKNFAREMLEKAGLKEVIDSYPHHLSGGMRQRASFIRALLSPQNVLLLDEPFSALDEFTRLDMQKWLLEIWEQDEASILFVTHNIEEALFLSDRIVVLTDSPASVKKVIDIPFSRPRDEALLVSDEFLRWKRKVLKEIR